MDKSMVKQSQALIANNRAKTLEQVLIAGDLSGLNESQRLDYVKQICKMTGVSLLARPFDYITLKGKLVLYANRACTEQLRRINKISIKIVGREKVGDLYVVTADATGPRGKTDSSIGAVSIGGLRGEDLANAMMKAETKAKRRVTLSICGLGILDEIEARQVAEAENKEAAQEAVAVVEEKVQDSKERPEFESVQTPVSDSEPGSTQPEATTIGDYSLLAGKSKGKRLKDLPMSKLTAWIKWYELQQAAGKELHQDIQLDAFNIAQFIEAAMLSKGKTNE